MLSRLSGSDDEDEPPPALVESIKKSGGPKKAFRSPQSADTRPKKGRRRIAGIRPDNPPLYLPKHGGILAGPLMEATMGTERESVAGQPFTEATFQPANPKVSLSTTVLGA